MRWAVILWLIVGVGAGASAQQVKDVRAEADKKKKKKNFFFFRGGGSQGGIRARTGGAQCGEDG